MLEQNSFDNTFPIDKIKELVQLIRAGEALNDIPRTIKLALWIAGSTLETFYPMLSETVFGNAEYQTVESLCKAIDNEAPDSFDGEVSTQAMNPLLLIAIARLLAKLLEGKK
jgi:hypothetical protein